MLSNKMIKQFGLKVRDYRIDKGKTQQNVADKFKSDKNQVQYISNIERGICLPSGNYWKALAKSCGLSKQEFEINFEPDLVEIYTARLWENVGRLG